MLARPAREFAGAFKLTVARSFLRLCSETSMIHSGGIASIFQMRVDDGCDVLADLPQCSRSPALAGVKLSTDALTGNPPAG
ncbi:hypothetical protein [Xanthomonas vasicola]|uniref:hypothetical protein n=1 Tax=Xanthomonas vasicola TaxID=56459 RepID=UPI00035C4261|nr:hypothetical protein KWI_0107560 [Xanthomonas vasicola pv. vasculorum NCPPB 206]